MRAKILLVEDNPDSCEFLTLLLQLKGYEVQTAADGLEALERIESFSPDIIISDIMMPKLDGIQLIRVLRSSAAYRHLPVVMLSAHGSGRLSDAVQAGADEVMRKPVDIDNFLRTLTKVIEQLAERKSGFGTSA